MVFLSEKTRPPFRHAIEPPVLLGKIAELLHKKLHLPCEGR